MVFKARKVNDCFFDNIDSEEKSYLLGFFIADGHLRSQNVKGDINHMMISLSNRDCEILQYFQKYICPNSTLQKFNSKTKYKGEYKDYMVCKIQWTSLHMGEVLNKKYGISSNKSINGDLKFPDIPIELRRHFIRGFMDGDGTVRKGAGQYPTLNFVCTSKTFIDEIEKNLLLYIGGSTYVVLDSKDRKTPIWRLYLFSYSKNNPPGNNIMAKEVKDRFYRDLYNYLYKDAHLYLRRKKNRFDEIPS